MKRSAFTLIEIMIVVAIIALLAALAVPNLLRMGQKKNVAQATGDVALLKTAIDSYWQHNNYAYPANITTDLTGATPRILSTIVKDPFTKGDYQYALADSNRVYAVWSNGPNGSQNWTWTGSAGAGRTLSRNGGDDIVESNVPIMP